MNEDREPYENFMASMNQKFQEDVSPKDREAPKQTNPHSIPYAMEWCDTGDSVEINFYLPSSAKGARVIITPYDLTVNIADESSEGLYAIFDRQRFLNRIISENSFWTVSSAGTSSPKPLELPTFLSITLAKTNIDQHIPWSRPFENDIHLRKE